LGASWIEWWRSSSNPRVQPCLTLAHQMKGARTRAAIAPLLQTQRPTHTRDWTGGYEHRKCTADTYAVTDQDFENESEDERGSGEATHFGQLYLEETVLDLYSGVAGTQKKHRHEWYQQLVCDLQWTMKRSWRS
jgi:hypothetical protein